MKKYLRLFALCTFILLVKNGVYAQEGKTKKISNNSDKHIELDTGAIYLKVVEDGYKSPQIFRSLGNTFYFKNEYIDAVKWYKRLFDEYPDDTEPMDYYRAAQSLKTVGDYEESENLMKVYEREYKKSNK